MSDDRYKPRGTSGHIHISIGENGRPKKAFVPDEIGYSKAQIEQSVVDQFCLAMRRNGATIYSAAPKTQDDFDFLLELPGGKVNLELTEFIPPAVKRAKPYVSGHYSSTMGNEETRLLQTIRKKDQHYSKRSTEPVHLIVYPTDFSTRVYAEVLSLVRISLAENPPKVIENVFWVQISEIQELQLSILFPYDISKYPLEMRESVRAASFVLLDPTASQLSYNIECVGTHNDAEKE